MPFPTSRLTTTFGLACLALTVGSVGSLPARADDRRPVFSQYAVSADHPAAARAGASLLEAGGTAADAAAATMLALGVVSPAGSGLGGGGFALYYRASDRSLTFLDFRETAPVAAGPSMFEARADEADAEAKLRSRLGGLSVGVPGEPAGIAELVARFGKKSLAQVVAPAEALARDGFVVSDHLERLGGYLGESFAQAPLAKSVFGSGLKAGTQARNLALAKTLRRFGRQGPKLFYGGAVGRAIVAAVRREGGTMQLSDLKGYQVVTREPLRRSALGYDWVTAPAPSAGGYTVLSSLAFLEQVLPTAKHWSSSERAHALIESWKGPYLDREQYFGDPDHVALPLDRLGAPERRAERAARYHPGFAVAAPVYALPLDEPEHTAVSPEDHGTSHLCVVDGEGNIASVTTTVNLPFGSRIGVEGLWLNNEMDDFAREVGKENAFGLVGGAPNLPAAKKRPVSSMSPTIVFDGDTPVLCVGGSGGSRIPTAVEQVALYVLKDGLHPQEAIRAPRLHYQVAPERVDIREVPAATQAQLRVRGHTLNETPRAANVQAVRIVLDGGRKLLGGADPYKGGSAEGK